MLSNERAQAGEILNIAFTWRTDVAGQEDIVQYLHFVSSPRRGERGLRPTIDRLWYSGLADSLGILPAERPDNSVSLYRARDQERNLDARVRLGVQGTP